MASKPPQRLPRAYVPQDHRLVSSARHYLAITDKRTLSTGLMDLKNYLSDQEAGKQLGRVRKLNVEYEARYVRVPNANLLYLLSDDPQAS